MTYGSNTVVGNSTSVKDSFSSEVSLTVSVSGGASIFGFSADQTTTISNSYTQETDTASTIAFSQTTSNSTSLNGFSDPANGINHDYDQIFLWLNPIVKFNIGPNSNQVTWTGYGYDLNDPTNPDMDVFGVPVGCLNGDFATSNPPLWSTCQSYFTGPLARTWALSNEDGSGPGLTGDPTVPCTTNPNTDFCNILAADPFTSPNYTFMRPPIGSDTTTDGLFTDCHTSGCNVAIQYSPNITNTYMQGYSTTITQDQMAKYKYEVTYSVEDKFKGTGWLAGFTVDLTDKNVFTWSHEFDQSTNSSRGQQSSFTIVGPAAGYTGPCQFDVFQDNRYGTFMFWPVPNGC